MRGGAARDARDGHRKARPPARRRSERERVVQQRAEAADDREAEPHAATAFSAGAGAGLHELVEDPLSIGRPRCRCRCRPRRCEPSHRDGGRRVRRRLSRVAKRVGDKIAQDPLEQHRVGLHAACCRNDAQCQSARRRLCMRICRGVRANSGPSSTSPRSGTKLPHRGGTNRGAGRTSFQRLDGVWMLAGQRLHLRIARSRRQCGGEKAHRVQRLAKIMARRSKELAFRAVGRLRGAHARFRSLRAAP